MRNGNPQTLQPSLLLREHSPEHLSAEQGGVCAGANTTCYTWMTLLGKLNSATQDQQRSHLAQGSDAFNRVILAWLWWICVLGSTAPKCTPDTGSYPAYAITGLSLACRILSQALNACSQSQATSKWSPSDQSARKETKTMANFKKKCEPEVMTCQYHRHSAKNVTTCDYHTEDRAKSENVRASARSGASALNSDHIPQSSWESDQKK